MNYPEKSFRLFLSYLSVSLGQSVHESLCHRYPHLFAECGWFLDINSNYWIWRRCYMPLGSHIHSDISCAYNNDLLAFKFSFFPRFMFLRKS